MYYDSSGYVLKDSDYAKIMYDTDGSGYAYYQNDDYSHGLKRRGSSPFYEGSSLQAHHLLQGEWANVNLSAYIYDDAPTISKWWIGSTRIR